MSALRTMFVYGTDAFPVAVGDLCSSPSMSSSSMLEYPFSKFFEVKLHLSAEVRFFHYPALVGSYVGI
jgi:hypothetical protein